MITIKSSHLLGIQYHAGMSDEWLIFTHNTGKQILFLFCMASSRIKTKCTAQGQQLPAG